MKPLIKILFYVLLTALSTFVVALYYCNLLTWVEFTISASFVVLAYVTLKLAIKFDL